MFHIPKKERKYLNLTEADRKLGIVKLKNLYNDIKYSNGKILIDDVNFNRYLLYISQRHESKNTDTVKPEQLELKIQVRKFFSTMFKNIKPNKLSIHFTHLIMRECNRKEIPISEDALSNSFKDIFSLLESYDRAIPRRVSNFCGLYLTNKEPSLYLSDKDVFEDLFEEKIPLQDFLVNKTNAKKFYKYLCPELSKKQPATGASMKLLSLALIFKTEQQHDYTTKDEIVKELNRTFKITEESWGWLVVGNKNTKRRALKTRLNGGIWPLKKKGLIVNLKQGQYYTTKFGKEILLEEYDKFLQIEKREREEAALKKEKEETLKSPITNTERLVKLVPSSQEVATEDTNDDILENFITGFLGVDKKDASNKEVVAECLSDNVVPITSEKDNDVGRDIQFEDDIPKDQSIDDTIRNEIISNLEVRNKNLEVIVQNLKKELVDTKKKLSENKVALDGVLNFITQKGLIREYLLNVNRKNDDNDIPF